MYSSLLGYRVIAVGVNNSRGQEPLNFAESDARAIFRAFTGALGPPQTQGSMLLLGDRATKANVLHALDATARAGTDCLLLYFSGHGGDDGVCLADGILDHRVLRTAIKRVRSRSTLIILDSCHAASYAQEQVAGVEEFWADVLANATPGTRMFFATSANELSREGGIVKGGHFTWSLLQALHCGLGSIETGEYKWISDLEAFSLASHILHQHWPNDALPDSRKLGGDFPMLLSQADSAVGYGAVSLKMKARGVAADVTVQSWQRKGVPMTLKCRLLNEHGLVIGESISHLIPTKNEDFHEQHVEFRDENVFDKTSRALMNVGFGVPTQWAVELSDAHHGHVLGNAAKRMTYRKVA